MFECDECHDVQKSHTPEIKFISEKRPRIYEKRIVDKNGYTQFKHSRGWEIVKESRLCASCHSTKEEVVVNDSGLNRQEDGRTFSQGLQNGPTYRRRNSAEPGKRYTTKQPTERNR